MVGMATARASKPISRRRQCSGLKLAITMATLIWIILSALVTGSSFAFQEPFLSAIFKNGGASATSPLLHSFMLGRRSAATSVKRKLSLLSSSSGVATPPLANDRAHHRQTNRSGPRRELLGRAGAVATAVASGILLQLSPPDATQVASASGGATAGRYT